MMPSESASPFAEYLEKLGELEKAIKLVAYHTAECARQTEKAADYTELTVYYVKGYLHER